VRIKAHIAGEEGQQSARGNDGASDASRMYHAIVGAAVGPAPADR
jgi:hypothetical protein